MSFSKISDRLNTDIKSWIKDQPEEEWVEKISGNDKSGKDLVRFLEAIVDHADRKAEPKLYVLADQAVTQLTVRTLDKELQKKVDKLAKKIGYIGEKKLQVKSLEDKFRVEAAGIKIHGKTIHPHPSSKINDIAEKWEKSKTSKPLEKYIEKKAPSSVIKDMKSRDVKYLDKEGRKKYEVTFDKKGKIEIGGKKPKDGDYIYALDASGEKLYAGEKKMGEFHHSSFLSGTSVRAAGTFPIKNKKIDSTITGNSGHYKPDKKHTKNVIKYLSKKENLGKRKAEKLEIKGHESKSHKSSHKHSHSHKKHKHK